MKTPRNTHPTRDARRKAKAETQRRRFERTLKREGGFIAI